MLIQGRYPSVTYHVHDGEHVRRDVFVRVKIHHFAVDHDQRLHEPLAADWTTTTSGVGRCWWCHDVSWPVLFLPLLTLTSCFVEFLWKYLILAKIVVHCSKELPGNRFRSFTFYSAWIFKLLCSIDVPLSRKCQSIVNKMRMWRHVRMFITWWIADWLPFHWFDQEVTTVGMQVAMLSGREYKHFNQNCSKWFASIFTRNPRTVSPIH